MCLKKEYESKQNQLRGILTSRSGQKNSYFNMAVITVESSIEGNLKHTYVWIGQLPAQCRGRNPGIFFGRQISQQQIITNIAVAFESHVLSYYQPPET